MSTPGEGPRWSLTLYVSGSGSRSVEAISAVRAVCDRELPGLVDLTIVDAAQHPDQVRRDHILAVPTLVKHAPSPPRHLVGDFSDLDHVRSGLDLGPVTASPVSYRGPEA